MKMQAYNNIDEYIANFPEDIQSVLQKVRQTIHKASPDAVEAISYGIPTFKLNGKNLIHFMAAKAHIGLYPGPNAVEAFSDKLISYETSKGTIRFPLDKPIPYDLVEEITLFGVKRISG